jgi:hypothetical protein
VAIGFFAGVDQTTGSHNIYIRNRGVSGESGQIKIGNTTDHTQATIAGIHGSTVDNASDLAVLVDNTGKLGTMASSLRFKQDVQDMGEASDQLMALRPVTFRYREDPEAPQYGLIAEEVSEVAPELVAYDEDGQPYSVRYHVLAPMLLNELQKERQTNEKQAQTIQEQRARLAQLEVESMGSGAREARTLARLEAIESILEIEDGGTCQ